MSPAAAHGLQPGAAFRYCGLRYTLAEVYATPAGKVFLVPTYGKLNPDPAPVMFPADQCDLDRAPVRTPAKRRAP